MSTLYLFEGYLGFNKYKLDILIGEKTNLEVYEDLIEKKKGFSIKGPGPEKSRKVLEQIPS